MKRNFKWPSMQRGQCLIYNSNLKTFILSTMWKIFNSDNSYMFPMWNHFCRKVTNENNQFSKLWTLISNLYLIRQRFQGYRCESRFLSFNGGSRVFSNCNKMHCWSLCNFVSVSESTLLNTYLHSDSVVVYI